MPEFLQQENREIEKKLRLEIVVYFIRHGQAEKLPGGDRNQAIDAERKLTAKGREQVDLAGEKIGEAETLAPGDVVFARSSPFERSDETLLRARNKFLEKQKEKGVGGLYAPLIDMRRRDSLVFPDVSGLGAYEAGGERRKDTGGTSGLSEEWTRHPELLQEDMAEAGLTGEPAEAILAKQKNEFQQTIAVAERASHVFHRRWQKGALEDTKPPKVVLLIGSHGFVSEPWLLEAVKEYETATGNKVPLELGYGEYWKLHLPPNLSEPPTLTIGGHTLPLKEALLKKVTSTI